MTETFDENFSKVFASQLAKILKPFRLGDVRSSGTQIIITVDEIHTLYMNIRAMRNEEAFKRHQTAQKREWRRAARSKKLRRPKKRATSNTTPKVVS